MAGVLNRTKPLQGSRNKLVGGDSFRKKYEDRGEENACFSDQKENKRKRMACLSLKCGRGNRRAEKIPEYLSREKQTKKEFGNSPLWGKKEKERRQFSGTRNPRETWGRGGTHADFETDNVRGSPKSSYRHVGSRSSQSSGQGGKRKKRLKHNPPTRKVKKKNRGMGAKCSVDQTSSCVGV